MASEIQSPVETPVVTPTPETHPVPWDEVYTDPNRICEQQTRELASPDVAP